MSYVHNWKLKKFTTIKQHVMIDKLFMELESVLDNFKVINEISLFLPPNYDKDMLSINDITQDIINTWANGEITANQRLLAERQAEMQLDKLKSDWDAGMRTYSDGNYPWQTKTI
jgi:hypothetical protein